MFVCARDIVARTSDFDILAQNMTLRPWQWEMLHSFDDRTSLGAIARRIGVDLASITESLSALEQHGLIKIRTVTREEYRRVFEMASPGTVAPAPHGVDDDDDFPVAKAAPVETPAPRLKPVPPTGEPLSVRLEALRAKAEQAQAQRPPAIDTVPFQGQAAPTTIEIDTAEMATKSAAVEIAQAPPEPAPAAGFGTQLADLKARLDEVLVPAAEPEAEAPPAAPASQPLSRGGLADFTDALTGHSTETVAEAPAAPAPAPPAPEPVEEKYAPPAATSVNGNGTAAHPTIAFSLAGEPPPKPKLSPDAIEFSLGGTTPDTETPKPPPLKY
jgi:hypothetical protein